MPAATDKTGLLDVTAKEFAKLQKLLATVPDGFAVTKFEGDTSIKDTIGHRAKWIDLFLGWYSDGQAGNKVYFPAKGYKWNELVPFNAAIREEQKDMGWQVAQDYLNDAHSRLTDLLESLNNDQLYGEPMKGANNKWTTGRWAEAAGPSHYRSAAKYIRKLLRENA